MNTEKRHPRILYVEDDETLQYIIRDNLEREGFTVEPAFDGVKAWELFTANRPDICVLDVNLPKMDGFTLARRIRENDQDIPIIFVTAKSLKEDKLEGLILGGDDYLVKPFSIEELILKIRVFLKRSRVMSDVIQSDLISFSRLTLNLNTMILTGPGGETRLTAREAELLAYFVRNTGKLLSREQLLANLWGGNDYFAGRSLDVFISRLRKYLAADPTIRIENRHGIGFIFKMDIG